MEKLIITTKPSARAPHVRKIGDREYEVAVLEPPEKGKANRAIIHALAEYFHIPSSAIRIAAGHASRKKIVRIQTHIRVMH